MFRPREDKEDATKKNTEAPPQLVLACQQVVDTLVESVLRIEQVSFNHGCQMAKFDPFLSLDCAMLEGVGAQSKERMGSNFAA